MMDPQLNLVPPTAIMLRRRLGEDSTSTQSPTDASTHQKSSSSRNSYSNSIEPLLTTGEKIGALFIGTVSILIGLYFLIIFVRVRRYRKKQPFELEDSIQGRRKRPKSMAEKADRHEDSSLTILGGDDFGDDASSINAIIDSLKTNQAQNNDDDNSTKASTIELTEASHYSLSSDDGDTSSAARNKNHKKNTSKSKNKRTKSTESSSAMMTEFSTRSYSFTSVLVNAILPGHSNDDDDDDDDTNLDSYYTRHNDDNDDDDDNNDIVEKKNCNNANVSANDNDDESTGTFSSPFHPLPSPTTTTTATQQRHESFESNSKSNTYFLSNDDSVLCGEAEGNNNNNSAMEEDVFSGIPDKDRPFDCDTGLPARDDKPFDCY